MCCEGWSAKGISPVQINGSNLIGEFARDVRKLKVKNNLRSSHILPLNEFKLQKFCFLTIFDQMNAHI